MDYSLNGRPQILTCPGLSIQDTGQGNAVGSTVGWRLMGTQQGTGPANKGPEKEVVLKGKDKKHCFAFGVKYKGV